MSDMSQALGLSPITPANLTRYISVAAQETLEYAASAEILDGLASFYGDGGAVGSLIIGVGPKQEGSGDPSPDNVRPISGWTGAIITRSGKNLLRIIDGSYRANGVTVDVSDGNLHIYGTATANAFLNLGTVKTPTETLVFSATDHTKIFYLYAAGENPVYSGDSFSGGVDRILYCRVNEGVQIDAYFNLQIERGSIPSAYEPYRGATLSISWQTEAGTVYGGMLDVTTGLLSVYPYYASYAGETLAGPWISSMDVYAEGAVPTTSAQVVDLGGSPTTYQLTPTEVMTLLGLNNIWADCGPIIKLTY